MSESKGATKAVDVLVDAIRAEEPPALDWDVVERSLLARVRRGEGARPVARPSSGAWRVLSFAAAAAIVPVALSMGSGSGGALVTNEEVRAVDAAAVAAFPGSTDAHDLTTLRSGDAIEAKGDAVTFADAGKVRWTLSPESRLIVRSPLQEGAIPGRPGAVSKLPTTAAGVGHVVRLERGSLRVEVEPDLVKEGLVDILAVEVGNTRVAVHGTVFTVTVLDGEVVVDVERGVVTVGPTGQRGATTGYQLPAGSRAAFSLDGGRSARWVSHDDAAPIAAAPRRVASAPALPIAAAPAVPAAPTEPALDDVPAVMDPPPASAAKVALGPKSAAATQAEEAPVDVAPAPSEVATPPKPSMTSGGVQAGLRRCFSQAHPSSSVDGPKLTASSTFTLTIRADGTVKAAQFNPPLPSIQGCAAFVWGASFAPAAADYTLSIPVQLSQ